MPILENHNFFLSFYKALKKSNQVMWKTKQRRGGYKTFWYRTNSLVNINGFINICI